METQSTSSVSVETALLHRIPVAMVSLDWDVVDLIDSLSSLHLLGIFDSIESSCIPELVLLGSDNDWPTIKKRYPELKVVLAIDLPEARSKLLEKYGPQFAIGLLSPNAYVSPRATIGFASIVQRGVTVMPKVKVGTACKLHINATLHHESVIGDFCTIAPGAQILGNVHIGDRSYIGAGAIIRQRSSIGHSVKVGAGAVVVGDIPDGATVVGVPATRRLDKS